MSTAEMSIFFFFFFFRAKSRFCFRGYATSPPAEALLHLLGNYSCAENVPKHFVNSFIVRSEELQPARNKAGWVTTWPDRVG